MRALQGELVLTAWEQCRDQSGPHSALAILALALPAESWERLAAMPLAQRNALLLQVRATTFGPTMEGFALCPECGTQLEFSLDLHALLASLCEQQPDADLQGMRPVTSLDLLATLGARDEAEARLMLVSRTLGATFPRDQALTPEVAAKFDQCNAAAEIRVQLQCAFCAARPVLDLDPERFLRRELTHAAHRLLEEAHPLASAYGWGESSILAMNPARRTSYLEMLTP